MTRLPRYEGILIDGRTAGILASSESDLARFDAIASKSVFKDALRRQLIRIDALCSSSVDGRHVDYDGIAKFETAVMNSPFSDDSDITLFKLARKLGLNDETGSVVCYRYMRVIEWVSTNIHRGSKISKDIFGAIRRLYNENDIALLIDLDDSEIGSFESSDNADPSFEDSRLNELFQEYIDFINADILTPSAQAELSHAHLQFIEPYSGNLDAYERVFSYVVFYRRGLLTDSIAPLASGPSRDVKAHVRSIVSNMRGLTDGIFTPDMTHAAFRSSAYCTEVATTVALVCLNMLSAFWATQQEKLGAARRDSAVLSLAKLFLEWPYLTVAIAAEKLNRSFSATNNAMHELLKCGYITESGRLSKHRLFCATELVDAVQGMTNRVISEKTLDRDTVLSEILEEASRTL